VTQEQIDLPFFVVGAEDTPILFSNLIVAQHEEREFILTFCQYTPPLALGPPERQRDQIKSMPYLPVKAIARIGLTPQRLEQLIGVLQANYETWKRKQQGGTE